LAAVLIGGKVEWNSSGFGVEFVENWGEFEVNYIVAGGGRMISKEGIR
jgi:hypothetical protein